MRWRTIPFLFAASSLLFIASPLKAHAEFTINIGINAPLPTLVVAEPPEVLLIPGTYVYFAPGIDVDVLFYHGNWYRSNKGRWYRAQGYNGPWVFISKVPGPVANVPPGFRHVPPGQEKIPYGQLKKNWKTWEDEKHWDKHEAKSHKKEHKEGKGKGKWKHEED